MDPNREHLKKLVDKNHKRDFSFWGWVLRLVSLCIAFGSIIYYLANNNGPVDPYEESSLFEEALFSEEESGEQLDEGKTPEDSKFESEAAQRPDIQIPVFRSGE